ncbi:MAG: NUDIX domain-containing protein [Thermoplasmata archaeon]|nr:NUDIX domain-containing protein [Thermoplasmata archaeon]
MAASAHPIDQECVEGYLFAGRPPRLLVLRRPPERGQIWVPVSGKVERRDGDYPSALLRELLEETGFSEFLRIFPLDWEVEFEGPGGGRWRLHAFGVELAGERVPRLSAEHEDAAWLDLSEAAARLHYPDNRDAVERLRSILAREQSLGPPPNA